jgi:hypothetical protein
MLQAGDEFDLAVEQLAGTLRLNQIGREKFQGDEPTHSDMLGFENTTHASLSDRLEDLVLAQEEAFSPTRQKHAGLEARQDFSGDQELAQLPAIGGFRRRVIRLPHLFGWQQAAAAKPAHEQFSVDLRRGHGRYCPRLARIASDYNPPATWRKIPTALAADLSLSDFSRARAGCDFLLAWSTLSAQSSGDFRRCG